MGLDPFTQSILLFVASTAYQITQQKKMKKKQAAAEEARKGFYFTSKFGDATSLPVIYGRNLLGGVQTKLNTHDTYVADNENSDNAFSQKFPNSNQGGSKNEFLTAQYALCHEGIEGVQWVKVNDKHYNDVSQKFNHRIRTFNNGGTACAVSTANGVSDKNKFTGCAFATATYKLNRDEQNYSGDPDVQFFVKGQKLRDVARSGSAPNYTYTLATTYAYSNNPALVLLDYLLSSAYGRGLSVDDVNLESFFNSARVCEVIVTTGRSIGGRVNGVAPIRKYPNETLFPATLVEGEELYIYYDEAADVYFDVTRIVGDGETVATYTSRGVPGTRDVPLYECNITLNTESSYRDNIELLLSTMGLAELVWTGKGEYKLLVDYPTTTTEVNNLIDTSHVFDKDSIIREQLSISWNPAESRLNQVTVTYEDEHEDFKTNSVSWPPTGSTVHNKYLTEDNQQPFKSSLSPSGLTDPYHALAAAEQAVRKARSIFTVSLTVNKKGLSVEPGDLIKINLPEDYINNEIFRVESVEVNSDFTVNLSVYLFDFEVLAWNINDDIAYGTENVTNFDVDPVTNLAYSPTPGDIRENTLGQLTWDSENSTSHDYRVSARVSGVGNYQFLGTTGSNFFDISHLENISAISDYDFKVQVVGPFGHRSNNTFLLSEEVNAAPPEIIGLQIEETQYVTNSASGLKNRVKISWEAGTGGLKSAHFIVEYKTDVETNFQVLGTTQQTTITLPDLSSGLYNFKVTPVSYLEFSGTTTTLNKTIVGYSEDPADPSGFNGNINEGQITLGWDAPTDLDVLYGGHSQIRFHSAVDGTASWDTASVLVEKLSGNTTSKTVPTLKGTFLIRFYDAFGNFSANSSSFVSTFVDTSFNVIETIDEATPGFLGSKTNCSVVSGDLTLDAAETLMTYEFNQVVDMQEVVQARLVPSVTASVVQGGVTIASYSNISLVNNIAGPLANASISVFVSTTDDDPAGTPTWSSYQLLNIGSYSARGIRFKLVIEADDASVEVFVTELEVDIDKKDITKTGTSTSSASADVSVTFATPFYGGISSTSTPTMGIMTIGGSDGDNVVISSRTRTGFSYSVYNNSTRVVRNIDWQAIGQ